MKALVRPFWFGFGWLCVGLGAAGVFLPLLPTTPFMLLAAFCFARSSPRFHDWLLGHKRFGPLILNWQRHGSISRRAKASALLAMALALIASYVFGAGARLLGLQAAVLACSALFILTRPNGPAETGTRNTENRGS